MDPGVGVGGRVLRLRFVGLSGSCLVGDEGVPNDLIEPDRSGDVFRDRSVNELLLQEVFLGEDGPIEPVDDSASRTLSSHLPLTESTDKEGLCLRTGEVGGGVEVRVGD